MVLSAKELRSLLQFLQEGENKSFDAGYHDITKHFQRGSHFQVATALLLLVQEDLLAPPQRLQAIFAIVELFHFDPRENPFLASLLDLFETPDRPHADRWFLSQILSHGPKEFAKKIPRDVVLQFDPSTATLAALDTTTLRRQYTHALEPLPGVHFPGVVPVIRAPQVALSSLEESVLPQEAALTPDDVVPLQFEPRFARPPPPLAPAHPAELPWYDYVLLPELQWDPQLACDEQRLQEAAALLHRAMRQALPPAQQQLVLAVLLEEPRLLQACGLTPARLPGLVDGNPQLAAEALRCVPPAALPAYLEQLMDMPKSVHAMEVVNRLTTALELPPTFLHLFISRCLQACEQTQDKYLQSRLVRCVCVFLQSLIRNNRIVDGHDLLLEVQAFCLEHRRLKEALALFKLVREVDQPSASTPGTPVAGTAAGSATAASAAAPGTPAGSPVPPSSVAASPVVPTAGT